MMNKGDIAMNGVAFKAVAKVAGGTFLAFVAGGIASTNGDFSTLNNHNFWASVLTAAAIGTYNRFKAVPVKDPVKPVDPPKS